MPADPPTKTEPSSSEPPRGSKGRISVRRIAQRERDNQALELRKAGYSLAQIAERLGYASKGACYDQIMSVLDRHSRQAADDLRDIMVDRLDTLLRALMPLVIPAAPGQKPDFGAIDRILAIEAQRARLLGLNAPEKIDLSRIVDEYTDARGYSDEERQQAKAYLMSNYRELVVSARQN
jgi:hypothetical protein